MTDKSYKRCNKCNKTNKNTKERLALLSVHCHGNVISSSLSSHMKAEENVLIAAVAVMKVIIKTFSLVSHRRF